MYFDFHNKNRNTCTRLVIENYLKSKNHNHYIFGFFPSGLIAIIRQVHVGVGVLRILQHPQIFYFFLMGGGTLVFFAIIIYFQNNSKCSKHEEVLLSTQDLQHALEDLQVAHQHDGDLKKSREIWEYLFRRLNTRPKEGLNGEG